MISIVGRIVITTIGLGNETNFIVGKHEFPSCVFAIPMKGFLTFGLYLPST